MILAAGLGTRLKPLTDAVPKPLVPVGDMPMIAHVIQRLRASGCAPIVANAYHLGAELARYCDGANVLISSENELLGTAGGIAHATSLLGSTARDVLVHNGDVLVDADLLEVIRAHGLRGADATLVTIAGPKHTGNVGTDESGRVVRLRTETFAKGEVSGGEFTGVHVISAHVRKRLPARGCIIGDVYMPLLRGREIVIGMHVARGFVDVGSPPGYLQANREWLTRHAMHAFVAPSATVGAGVVLDESVVCDGANVGGEGSLARCVVWPGATATAPSADTIYGPNVTVTLRK